jgi:hypothetical protein
MAMNCASPTALCDDACTHKEAMRETIPFSIKLYVDDDMIGLIEIYTVLFFKVLFAFAEESKGKEGLGLRFLSTRPR